MKKKNRGLRTFIFCFLLMMVSQSARGYNVVPIFLGAASISCGYVVLINPVVAMLGGATVALTTASYNAYQEYVEKNKKDDFCCGADASDAVVIAERFYYERKKEALEKIKKELIDIKDDLQIIKGLNSECFTYQFLKSYRYEEIKSFLPLSVAQEKCLSEDGRNRLRNARENELISLEKQVCEIQSVLALHLNQLIENIDWIRDLYSGSMKEIKRAIDIWNDNLNSIDPEDALKLYEYYVLRECLIASMDRAFNEFLIVSGYYQSCNSECIKSTTMIIALLDQIIPSMMDTKIWLLEEKKVIKSNSAFAERYFAQRAISVIDFKKRAYKQFDQEFKKRDTEVLKKIAGQLQVNSCFGGGPKKDDDDEREDNELESLPPSVKISEDDAPHMFANRSGHLIDTPANRKLLIDLVSNKNNFLGLDKHLNEWYGKIMEDGRQLWAIVRAFIIRNGGINDVPRAFNPGTGLCKPFKPFK